MSGISIRRHNILLLPQNDRVLIRPFIPGSTQSIITIIGRTLAISESETDARLADVRRDFESRHLDFESLLMAQYKKIVPQLFTHRELSRPRKLLLGALFSGEYALESAALFNPSIVPHPDQSHLPKGALRFILSLRATGEGHISSIEFRSGLIGADGVISLDEVSGFVSQPEIAPNPSYQKKRFIITLHEMGLESAHFAMVTAALAENFTREDLNRSLARVKRETIPTSRDLNRSLDRILWLAESNYEMSFKSKVAIDERVVFPVSPNESNGIEDARFVRFIEDDGTTSYFATYTAYNGRAILPQLIQTGDFLNFQITTLNGSAVQNKGMALFPRRIDGRYAMLSRQDDENLFIMFSDDLYFWTDPQILLRPAETWESVKIGNCGSPIETSAGWLVITHGVGPMRKYSIGAALLDLDDPTKVKGRLREPLIVPEGNEREGYVPNVVYSCGSLVHGGNLILPYAMSDKASTVVSIPLDELLDAFVPS